MQISQKTINGAKSLFYGLCDRILESNDYDDEKTFSDVQFTLMNIGIKPYAKIIYKGETTDTYINDHEYVVCQLSTDNLGCFTTTHSGTYLYFLEVEVKE